MKIMFVCGAGLVGGKERQTLEYMLELRDRGHQVYCAISSWASGDFEQLLTANDIHFSKIRIGFISATMSWEAIRMTLHQVLYLPSLYWAYRRLIRRWDPCIVVHSNFHHLLVLLPLIRSARQVFHVHDVFASSRKFRQLFRLFNRQVDMFVGVSDYVCRNLDTLGVPNEKVSLIYNGVRAPSTFTRVANSVPIVGVVGQIGAWKGHDILIAAMSALQDLSWKLYVIGFGDASYIASLNVKIAEAGMGDRVVFTGKRSALNDIYIDLDIVCVPSLFEEPFGLVAAEPGFFEIPVVVTDRGGLPEIVVDGQTGRIVPAGDAMKLAGAIRELLIDPDKRRLFGISAQQRVRKLFSIEASGLKMEDLLLRICEK